MIEITFDNSVKEVSAFGLTQWDKGQKLKILWADMPEEFQVHFSSRGSQEAIVVSAEGKDGEAEVDIPDLLLKNSADIFAWIYLIDGGSIGESVKRAVLYVRPRAKPHTTIDDLKPSQKDLLEGVLIDINNRLEYLKANGTDATYVPDYVANQAREMVKKTSELINENTVVFLAASDINHKAGDYNSEIALKHMSQAMEIVAKSCPLDFMVYLGDMISEDDNKSVAEAKGEIFQVNEALSPIADKVPSLRVTGGLDAHNTASYRNGEYITSPVLYNLIYKWNKDIVAPESEKVRGYGYRDFEAEKLRIIVLNTCDTHGTELKPYTNTAIMSSAQLQWFCETLDLSSKSDSENWSIIILGHHPLDMIKRYTLAVQALEAYVKGTAIDLVNSDGKSVAYDFAGKNSAKILGQFHGHLHNYRVSFITSANIPLIAVPNAGYYDNNFYIDPFYTNEENALYSQPVTYDKTAYSSLDTAFCIMVADKVTGEINAIHYGAGIDRNIVGTDVEESLPDDPEFENPGDNTGDDSGDGSETDGYINRVPLSITSTGEIYNGVGYLDDNKLTNTGNVSYGEGYVHTGFIPAKISDVIRISGGTYDGTIGNSVSVYNKDFVMKWITSLEGVKDEMSGIDFTESGVIVFTPEQARYGNLSEMAYIRVSTKGKGEELIVTVNQEIDDSGSADDVVPPSADYTNIVQYAVDAADKIYAGKGYSTNYALNSNGSGQSLTGYTTVGFLEVDADAVLRIKNINFNGSNGCYICLYDSDKNFFKCITLTGNSDSANGITVSNSIVKFTPADASFDISKLAYFRVSGLTGSGEPIITYCEEIS